MSSAVHPDESRELAALRRRAYGPDADIAADPAALARLRELERLATSVAPPAAAIAQPVAAAPPVRAVEPAAADEPDGAAQPVTVDESAQTRVPPPPPPVSRPWWRRPATVIAALAIALVVAVAASLVTAAGERPDRTLSATPASAEIPFPEGFQWLTQALGISRDALRSYRGVGDIVVWAGRSRDGVNCLLIAGPDSPFGFGCSRDGQDATADIVLEPRMASIPPTGLPERSTIRFVYRGDRVDVWIIEAPEPAPTT